VTYVQAESLGDDGYSDVIQVILDSYDDPAGAQAAFAFESDVEAITAFDAEIETDVETYGVESYAISLIGESDTGQEFGGVAISFRINAVNATVAILDYDGDVPKIADVEPLAESLEVRIEAAVTEGTETLGLAAVTVEGDDVSAASGYYLRIDGQSAPIAGETADALEVRDDGYGDAEAIYGTFHRIAAGEDGFEDDGSINMWLYRFATDQSTGEWFDDLAESLQLEENVAPDLGDESLGYATVIDLGAADDATGFVVYVLTGQYVVLIDVNAVGGVELATVEVLLEEQLACLDDGVCDDPVPVPDELSGGDALD